MVAEPYHLRAKYRAVHQRLVEAYGEPVWRPHGSPVDRLVSTILSQNTSGVNRERAFQALKAHYPDWEALVEAPVAEIQALIYPAGLSSQKAPRIQQALRTILHQEGRICLDFLQEMPLPEAKAWLTSLKGVGPKTAALVLLFAFGRPAFPVDKNIHRVSQRLGLIDHRTSADQAQDIFEEIGDPDTFYAFHRNMIRHGREVCQAPTPHCAICPLQDLCDYYQSRVKA